MSSFVVENFESSGYEYINAKIAEALENGCSTAIISGNYFIDAAIILAGPAKNLVMYGIEATEGTQMIVDERINK